MSQCAFALAIACLSVSMSACGFIRSVTGSVMPTKSDVASAEASSQLVPVTTGSAEAPDGSILPIIAAGELEGGILLQELREGDGTLCRDDSWIVLHYHGFHSDGVVFDTTRGGKPRGPWPIGRLIPGLRQGIVGMHVGGIRTIVIPSALAYGDEPVFRDRSDEVLVPPGATLTYAVELVAVE
jgi:hypothetical protein